MNLHNEYGREAEGLESIYARVKPFLDKAKEDAQRNAYKIGKSERQIVLLKETLFAAWRAPVAQKLKLMELAGSSAEDIRRFSESLKLSATLVAPLEIASFLPTLQVSTRFYAELMTRIP